MAKTYRREKIENFVENLKIELSGIQKAKSLLREEGQEEAVRTVSIQHKALFDIVKRFCLEFDLELPHIGLYPDNEINSVLFKMLNDGEWNKLDSLSLKYGKWEYTNHLHERIKLSLVDWRSEGRLTLYEAIVPNDKATVIRAINGLNKEFKLNDEFLIRYENQTYSRLQTEKEIIQLIGEGLGVKKKEYSFSDDSDIEDILFQKFGIDII